MNVAMVLTIAGFILGAVGLIALRPQLNVTTAEPLKKSEAFSVPFRISNTGLTSLRNIRTIFYFHEIKVGGLTLDNGVVGGKELESTTLDRGETQTVICNLTVGYGIPKTADITLVVDYQLPWVPLVSFRRYFRFVGQYGDSWQWLAQPSADIQKDADIAVDHFRRDVHIK